MRRCYVACALLFVGLGLWLASSSRKPKAATEARVEPTQVSDFQEEIDQFQAQTIPFSPDQDRAGRQPYEHHEVAVVVFSSKAAMQRFMANLPPGTQLLGQIDKLHALRLATTSLDTLRAAVAREGGQLEGEFAIVAPPREVLSPPPDGQVVGSELLRLLGLAELDERAGQGVVIAVLDTGIADGIFPNVRHVNLVAVPSQGELHPHGTAVASVLLSSDRKSPGIVPGAQVLSVAVADHHGHSTSFLIAQGVMAAVEAGAQLINISLGGYGKCALLEAALAYAQSKGVVVVAAAGNSGGTQVMQPAASPHAVAVGAVDGRLQPLAFSNRGKELAMAAPGHGIHVHYPGSNSSIRQVSGTSFAAPVVTGAIAWTMASKQISSKQALGMVKATLNDVGYGGPSQQVGAGVPDLWRVAQIGRAPVADAAITGMTYRDGMLEIALQNQGTQALVNTAFELRQGGQTQLLNVPLLGPGDVRVFALPAGARGLPIEAHLTLDRSTRDARPSNNRFFTQVP